MPEQAPEPRRERAAHRRSRPAREKKPRQGSGPRRLGGVLVGLVLAGVAAATVGFSLAHTVVTLICLAVFDAGLFAAQVANQSAVLAIDPVAPARFNSAYMLVYFVGGSLGTACGAATVERFGWLAAAVIAASAIGVAATITLLAHPSSRSAEPA